MYEILSEVPPPPNQNPGAVTARMYSMQLYRATEQVIVRVELRSTLTSIM